MLVKRRETLSVERRADTKRNEKHSKELAQNAVHEGSPSCSFRPHPRVTSEDGNHTTTFTFFRDARLE